MKLKSSTSSHGLCFRYLLFSLYGIFIRIFNKFQDDRAQDCRSKVEIFSLHHCS